MSDGVTSVSGAVFEGRILVEDAGLVGMITLRADLGHSFVKKALKAVKLAMPEDGFSTGGLDAGVLWMSPDELLILCAYQDADALVEKLTKALKDVHALVVNVSDARTVLRLSGEGAAIRETLAKLSPADLRVNALPTGRVRRTRLAQVAAAFWFTGEDEAVVVAFRSVGDYVFRLVSTAAEEGSGVGYF
jgi:sarcosine oxidase subunit gamma